MENKLESLSGVMFKNFEKHEIGNLGQIVGGRRVTKSSSTGWYSNDNNGDNAWYVTRKQARRE